MRAASFMLFHSIEKFQGKLRDAEELGPQASAKNGTSCSRPAKPACSRRLGGGGASQGAHPHPGIPNWPGGSG